MTANEKRMEQRLMRIEEAGRNRCCYDLRQSPDNQIVV
jgi:hypothetical protein